MSMGNFVPVVSRINVTKIPFDCSDVVVEINSLNYFLNIPKTTIQIIACFTCARTFTWTCPWFQHLLQFYQFLPSILWSYWYKIQLFDNKFQHWPKLFYLNKIATRNWLLPFWRRITHSPKCKYKSELLI